MFGPATLNSTDPFNGIVVGNFGNGTFRVDGATAVVNSANTILGLNAGSFGFVSVDNGSTWNQTGLAPASALFVGYGGTGLFTVKDIGSSWTNARDIFIGGVTRGTFNVLNGATVTANRDTSFGVFAGSTGTLNVDGTGSTWTNATANRFMIVGGTRFGATGGAGIVNVTNGGQIITDSTTFIGYSAGSTGNVTVTGTNSTWTMNRNSIIGGNDGIGIASGGTGVFNVLNGGSLIVTAGTLVLGNSNDGLARGTLNVDAANFAANNVIVGGSGIGTVNITGGSITGVSGVIIGDCQCATGTVNVSGAGSQFAATSMVIGFDGTGTLNVSNGATASSATDAFLGFGFGAGTLNVNSGGTFTTPGSLILGFGNNATVTVSDPGSVLNVGTGTFIGTGGTGTSAVNILNGAAGNLGSIILGFGSVGILTVDATSQVNGTNYSQDVTGTFSVGITPTRNGTVTIANGGAGTIDLTTAGALVVNAKTTLAKTYTIMTADGGVAVNFSSVTVVGNANNLRVNYNVPCGAGCFAVELSVDTFSVSKILPPVTGRNPANVAAALDRAITSGVTFPDQFFNLFALTGSSLVNALSQVSGEGTAALQSASFTAGSLFNNAALNQLVFGEGSSATSVIIPPAQYVATPKARGQDAFASFNKAPAPPATQTGRWRIWTLGFGGHRSIDGNALPIGSANQSISNYGGSFGFDYQVSPDLLLGFSAGGSAAHTSVSARATTSDISGGHFGVYGMKTWGPAYPAAAISYGRYANSTSRTIAGVGPTETASGAFNSDQLSARLELGWKNVFRNYTLMPFVAIEPSALWAHSYAETSALAGGGIGILGLNFASKTTTSLPTFVGLQADTRLRFSNGTELAPYARLSWVHELEPNRQVTAAFVSVPGAAFTIDGARPASDAARLDAGAAYTLGSGRSLFANLSGEWSDVSQSYSATTGFRMTR